MEPFSRRFLAGFLRLAILEQSRHQLWFLQNLHVGGRLSVPDDLQLDAAGPILCATDVAALSHVDWCDVGRGIGVGVLVEGVVSGGGAAWRKVRCRLPLCRARKQDHLADDGLGVRAARLRAASLIGQVPLCREEPETDGSMQKSKRPLIRSHGNALFLEGSSHSVCQQMSSGAVFYSWLNICDPIKDSAFPTQP